MKKICYATSLLFSFFITFYVYSQSCPKHGSATTEDKKHLNVWKNHSSRIPSTQAQPLPLNMLITRSNKPDVHKFQEGAYVVTEGYIIDFGEQGPESCNCNRASKSLKNGDVHIALALSPRSTKKNCIVIEITPSFKKLHPDYDKYLVIGSKVRVYGYLIYDLLHESNATNTCNACGNVWRKTCWEVYPITKIEVL